MENDIIFQCFPLLGCVVLCEAPMRKRCFFALRVVYSSGSFRGLDANGHASEESQKSTRRRETRTLVESECVCSVAPDSKDGFRK